MLMMSVLLHVRHTYLCAALLLLLTFPLQGMYNYNQLIHCLLARACTHTQTHTHTMKSRGCYYKF